MKWNKRIKNKIFLIGFLFFTSLTLCSCNGIEKTTEEAPEKGIAIGEEKTLEMFEMKVVEISSVVSKELITKKEVASWIKAYYEFMERGEISSHIKLIDVNFDNIPELFFSQLGTDNSWINSGIFFHEDDVSEILIPDEFMPTDFQLYKDKRNNNRIWLAYGMYRDGNTYSYVWYKIDFEDFSNVKKSLFFKWKETLDGEGVDCIVTYELVGEDGTSFQTTKEKIDQRKKELFSNYERMNTFCLFSFWKEFESEENKMNRDLFYFFVKLYDSVKKENSQNNSLQLPVCFIANQNLYHNYQIGDFPISLVEMAYKKYNEKNEESVSVNCIQISRFSDQEIQSEINKELKEFTFSDWNGEKEDDFHIFSRISFVCKNYLSIQKWINYDSKDAIHPWNDSSGITFDLRTGKKVPITDIMVVDDRLKQKIYDGFFKTDRLTHEQCLEYGIYDDLWESVTKYKKCFFLEDEKIQFILGVPHSMGDYLQFEGNYEDLKDLLQEDFPVSF